MWFGARGDFTENNKKLKKLRKLILKYLFDTKNFDRNRLLQINNLSLSCSHKCIANVESFFTAGDTLYLVFQYCEGGSLKDLIGRVVLYEDILHESEIIDWFCQIALAINHLDKKHVFDKNVTMVDGSDYTSSTCGDSDDEGEENVNNYREIYQSPELLCGGEDHMQCNFDTSSSWALGCILYELCSLKKLFKNKQEIIYFKDHADAFNQHITMCSTSVTPNLHCLFKKMMLYDPKDRLTTSELLNNNFITEYIQQMPDSSKLDDDLECRSPHSEIGTEQDNDRTRHDDYNCDNYYIDGVNEDQLTADDILKIINSI
ncbi:hypothetical protein HELRODRAFT_168419 [Helobdella robusta]|uniref:non-specific serine/threonine protein kinase n=1 Tax=Helobdella robusta TaxID=6412 RepID=T1F0K5_HELRO|nr:hypothetical protein HELRODRAFT_168419 [Helobdella robusta]ESO09436.1 hypothetical protein HELRODRAFT_168419 [Helobdella robusta]